MPEANAVEVPEDVVSLVFTYMTAYQVLHRTARVKSGDSVLVHGAAGRVGTAILELGALDGLHMHRTCSGRDRAAVERLGAVAIGYRTEDFVARVRELPGKGVDVVLDRLGGRTSLGSFRALRPGGRLVLYGHYATLSHGHKSWRALIEWYAATATLALWGVLSSRRQVHAYRIQKLCEGRQVLPIGRGHPALPIVEVPATRGGPRGLPRTARPPPHGQDPPVVAERLPLSDARHAHELLDSSASKGKLVLVP